MGSEGNADGAQIQEVLHKVISSGSIASYITSPQGFQFRRLGTGKPIPGPGALPRVSDLWGPLPGSPPWALLAWGLYTTRDRELTTPSVCSLSLCAALAGFQCNPVTCFLEQVPN